MSKKNARGTEEALLASEQRFMSILRASLDAILLIDGETFVDCNEATARMLGYASRDEFLMSHPSQLSPPTQPDGRSSLEKANAMMQEAFENGYNRFEWIHRRANGEDFPVEVSLTPINYQGKTVLHCLWREITEQKRAEAALRASEQQYEQLVDNTDTGLVVIDENGLVVSANEPYLRLAGAKRLEDIVGHSVMEWTAPDEKENNALAVAICAAQGSIQNFETVYQHADGTRTDISINATVGKAADGGWRIASLCRNISERKRIEKERRQFEATARQQQKLESIGTLAGGVGHEINNPLNVIINYAQLLLDNTTDPVKVKDYAENIVKESDRVAVIVNNLLGFARRDRETHGPAAIADIVERTLSLMRSVLNKDQIDIQRTIQQNLPMIKCRSQQIQQVLMNLLANARDALNERYPKGSDDKVIRIEASTFEKEGLPWIRLTVEDHGNGIPPDVADRVFDPFFTTKTRIRGTGLGLSISHSIIKEHQGKLWFQTEPGKGTRFHVDLPISGD
jgi:PAS domain S-box-containing protein